MKQIILDPNETDNPSAERFLGVSLAGINEFESLEKFIPNSGDYFPFKRIESIRLRKQVSLEDLSKTVTNLREFFAIEEIPSPSKAGFIYSKDWDYEDYAFETEDTYVRVVWTTTA